MNKIWKTIRVFISSTFRDMQAERDWLVKRVFPVLRQRLEPYLLHLVDIDLRWGITREQADNDQVLGLCFQQIDECRPFFLGLLGGRYGWVPSSFPVEICKRYGWTQHHIGKSVTELEILYGVLNNPTMQGRALFCFRSEKFLNDIVNEQQRRIYVECPTDEELVKLGCKEAERRAGVRFQQLTNLKNQIRALSECGDPANPPFRAGVLTRWLNRLCSKQPRMGEQRLFPIMLFDDYPCTWDNQTIDPETKRPGRISGLSQFGTWVIEKLERAILDAPELQQHLASAFTKERNELAEEHDSHEKFIENRTLVYIGQKTLQDKLIAFVESSDAKPCLVTGPSGIGKSSALSKFCRILKAESTIPNSNYVILIHHFIGASPRSTGLRDMLRHLCGELKDVLQFEDEIRRDTNELSDQFREFMKKIPSDKRVVLVIDALDHLDKTDNAHLLYWLPQTPPQVRLIVSCIDDPDGVGQSILTAMRRRQPYEIKVEPLNDDDRRLIIYQIPSITAKTLDEAQVSMLFENKATRNPLFLLVALEELRGFGSFEQLNQKISSLPSVGDTLTAIFQQVIQRLCEDFNATTVRHLLTLLVCARSGLSERELLDLIEGESVTIEESSSDLFPILRQLRSYLQSRGPFIDFFHRHLAKATREEFFKADDNICFETHRKLAYYFEIKGFSDRHALGELPFHHTESHNWNKLESTLKNLRFLVAKSAELDVYELIGDFEHAFSKRRYENLDPILTTIYEIISRFSPLIDLTPLSTLNILCNSMPSDQIAELRSASTPQKGNGKVCQEKHLMLEVKDGMALRLLHIVPPNDLAYEGNTGNLATCGEDEMAILWNRNEARHARLLKHNDSVLNVIRFSPDGKLLAAGGDKGLVTVWEVPSGRVVTDLVDHQSPVLILCWSADGRYLASAGGLRGEGDHEIRVWYVPDWSLCDRYKGSGSPVKALAFSPSGDVLASGGRGSNVCHLYDLNKRETIDRIHYDNEIIGLVWSPDGAHHYAVTSDLGLRVSRMGPIISTGRARNDVDYRNRACVWYREQDNRILLAYGNRILLYDEACNLLDEQRLGLGGEIRGIAADFTHIGMLHKDKIDIIESQSGDLVYSQVCCSLDYTFHSTNQTVSSSGNGSRILWAAEDHIAPQNPQELRIVESNQKLTLYDSDSQSLVKLPIDLKKTFWRAPRGISMGTMDLIIQAGYGQGFQAHLRTGNKGRLWVINDAIFDLYTGSSVTMPCYHPDGHRLGGIYLNFSETLLFKKHPDFLFEVGIKEKKQFMPLAAACALQQILLNEKPIDEESAESLATDKMLNTDYAKTALPDFEVVEFAKNDRIMLLGGTGGEVAFLSLTPLTLPIEEVTQRRKELVVVMQSTKQPISAGAWGEDRDGATLVAIGTSGGYICIARLPFRLTGQLQWQHVIRLFSSKVQSLAYVTFNGTEYLAAAAKDGQMALIDPNTGECLTRILMSGPVHTLIGVRGQLSCVVGNTQKPVIIKLGSFKFD